MQKVRNKQKGMIAGARVLGASLILSTSLLAPIATVYAEQVKEEFLMSHCQMGFRQTMT